MDTETDQRKKKELDDKGEKERRLRQISEEYKQLTAQRNAKKAEWDAAYCAVEMTEIRKREREEERAAIEIKAAPHVCTLLGALWFIAFIIASAVITLNEIQPADELGMRLKAANCTLNNAKLPYNDECGNTPATKYYCIVVSLNFTVTQNEQKWIMDFKMTWPLGDAVRITKDFDKLFRPGDTRHCFMDGVDLEMYIPNVDDKRFLVRDLVIIAMIGLVMCVMGLAWLLIRKYRGVRRYQRLS